MHGLVRSVRVAVLVAALAVGSIAGASPADAATQQLNGVVVAPIATWGPRMFSTNFQGVVLTESLEVHQFRLVNHLGCCPAIILTASDGSLLYLQTVRESGTELVPNLLSTMTRELGVQGGTGRFAGASGTGTYVSTRTPAVPTLLLGSPVPVGAVMVGDLRLSVTTP